MHHLEKMLVTNLVLATKCYRNVMNKSPKIIRYTIATRYDAEYVVIGAIIPFVARSGCFFMKNNIKYWNFLDMVVIMHASNQI